MDMEKVFAHKYGRLKRQQDIKANVIIAAKHYAVLDVRGIEGCKATVEQEQRVVSPKKGTP